MGWPLRGSKPCKRHHSADRDKYGRCRECSALLRKLKRRSEAIKIRRAQGGRMWGNLWSTISKSELNWFHAYSAARDEHAFRLRSMDQLKFSEIAVRLGVTESRAKQMIGKHQRRMQGLTKW